MQNMASCEKCADHKPYKIDKRGPRVKTVTGYVNVPKGGFKIPTTTIYFKKEDAVARAVDKSRIQSIAFEIEE